MIKHIVLETTEKDIQNFYVDILGGTISKTFSQNDEDAKEIFQLFKPTEVRDLDLPSLKIRLFIHDSIVKDSLQHVCLELDNALDVFQKATKKHYWTYTKKSDDRETYFIRDNNRNLFEIRSN